MTTSWQFDLLIMDFVRVLFMIESWFFFGFVEILFLSTTLDLNLGLLQSTVWFCITHCFYHFENSVFSRIWKMQQSFERGIIQKGCSRYFYFLEFGQLHIQKYSRKIHQNFKNIYWCFGRKNFNINKLCERALQWFFFISCKNKRVHTNEM